MTAKTVSPFSGRDLGMAREGSNFVLVGRGLLLLRELLFSEPLTFERCRGCGALIAFEPADQRSDLCAACAPAAGRKPLPGLRLVNKGGV